MLQKLGKKEALAVDSRAAVGFGGLTLSFSSLLWSLLWVILTPAPEAAESCYNSRRSAHPVRLQMI
jgi:hypothetical protein